MKIDQTLFSLVIKLKFLKTINFVKSYIKLLTNDLINNYTKQNIKLVKTFNDIIQ